MNRTRGACFVFDCANELERRKIKRRMMVTIVASFRFTKILIIRRKVSLRHT